MAMGNSWFARNQRFDVPNYTYYYMYAFERYKSFQESLEGKTEAEPRWYSQGTEYLIRTQQKDGSWNWGQSQGGSPDVNAAWALLFLLRGTRKSLQQNTSEQGSLLAGKSLPKNLSQIRVNAKGQIIDETQVTPIDEMLALLEDGNGPASDFIEGIPNELDLAGDPAQRASQIARLRRLASAGSFQARLTAVGTLGRDRNLDNVPALIFALSDPDLRIREAALKGLQFVSRKFGAFAVPEDAPPAQWLAAQAKWKQWYLSIRPEGTLLH
jgi:hypothetical protein